MTTTATTADQSEWTAAALRPAARWVPVAATDGRTRLAMVWSVPSVSVPAVVTAA